MKVRLIQEVGTGASLRVYWGGQAWDSQKQDMTWLPDVCPSCLGGGKPGYHDARIHLAGSTTLRDWKLGGRPDDYPDDRWPRACDHCGAPVPGPDSGWVIHREGHTNPDGMLVVHCQVFRERLFDSPSGVSEPGNAYWLECPGLWGKEPGEDFVCPYWDNCTGRHLHVILPNGHDWDVDSRARNCTLPQERTHRCWVRHGDPPDVTVDKAWHTCAAGAGSIGVPGWHGFLRSGHLVLA